VCAEKVDGECDEVHTGLTRHHVKSLGTTSAELYHVYRTSDPHAAALTPQFSSTEPLFIRERGLSAAKLKRKCDTAHTVLTRHHVKSPLQRSQSSTTFIAPGTPTPLH
jgi:hypothetical protein